MSGPLPEEVVQAFLERCRREWVDAGLGEHLEDPDVLDRIAAIVVSRPGAPVNDRATA